MWVRVLSTLAVTTSLFALNPTTSVRPLVNALTQEEPLPLSLSSSSSPFQLQEDFEFQPALIGFRCQGPSEVTPDGIVVIEANSPVRVTLFGESFTTDTIVGFTTEFAPKRDAVDRVILANSKSKLGEDSGQVEPIGHLAAGATEAAAAATAATAAAAATAKATAASNRTRDEPEQATSVDGAVGGRPQIKGTDDIEAGRRRRPRRRRLLDRSYDCTDYDRVISYRLSEENIITPNVAVLTIVLPELEARVGSGMYYYFCVKQPLGTGDVGAVLGRQARAAPTATGMRTRRQDDERASAGRAGATGLAPFQRPQQQVRHANDSALPQRRAREALFWVHQGDEWWLVIKVEPPILSIANDCVLIVLLLFLSAVTSGLNLGLMSLDMNELAVISSCGDQRERSYARAIAPLRKRGNYLLCSLLLGNVMVNSTLTVILEEMTSGLVAVIGSTLAIVVLGEIVPQAFCARQGLAIGARTIYLTYAFMLITFPLSYPISCLLDCVLGEEKGNVYDRERLMEFIRITGNHTQLEADEVAIISGALKLKKIRVDQIMTRIEDVFMLPIDCMLDRQTIRSIIEKGYSRIPIYEFNDRKQIVALILAKDLALLDPDDQMPLASMLMYCKHPLIFIEDTATLDVALNEFKTGKSHLAIVRQLYDDGEVDKYYEAIGVVTLEDVIEEVLQTEINDETDTLSDNRRKRRRTEAQVAHLVGELIDNCSPAAAAAVAPNLKAIVASAQQQANQHQQLQANQQQAHQQSLSSTKF